MSEVALLSKADPVMAGLIEAVGPYTLEPDARCPPFKALARAITYQQLNGTAARTIFARFIASCADGAPFPRPEAVVATPAAKLRAAGLSYAKIAALKDLATKTLEGVVPTRARLARLSDEEVIERLTQVRGIGRWTVEMMLMFQLGRPDILPVDDFGVRNGFRLAYALRKMPEPRVLARYGECWKPYRTAAAWYLWRAVDLSRNGALPAPPVRIRLPRAPRRLRRKRARTQ
jgi:DNA-3-methyladenine glycosylase II